MAEQWPDFEAEVTCPCLGSPFTFVQYSPALIEVLNQRCFPLLQKEMQLTICSLDPEDGRLLTESLDGLTQAVGVHLFPCHNAQELLVVLGLVIPE